MVQRPFRHGPAQPLARLGRAQIRLRRQIGSVAEQRGTQSLVSIWSNQFQLWIYVRTKIWLQIYVSVIECDNCAGGFASAVSPDQKKLDFMPVSLFYAILYVRP